MAHFAELDNNNIVLRVIVVADEHEADGENWCNNFAGGTWKQTSYNGNMRYNFAGIGFTYDADADAFIPPKPYNSWVLDETTYQFNAPEPFPSMSHAEGKQDTAYVWHEDTLSWVARPKTPAI